MSGGIITFDPTESGLLMKSSLSSLPNFHDDAAEFVPQRERPWQLFGPVAFEDMQIGAADAAGADLNERGVLGDLRPWHGTDHRRRAGAGKGRDADLFHAACLSS